ncbi:transposase [Umezawaea tangerina]|uniref:DDE superfamily endonuclease n=1 Tax=Umezawaea tangerina TaxID=84725 RepID=A0A2T0SWV5_9PSEU|nr:transposase [Umezawaea tangerina]PRY37904.1 DDE superfamily endonuclease [Umezawaea tangerina]
MAEIGPLWQAQQEARLVSRPRSRAPGAGAKYRLVFVDRLLATVVHLRHGTKHDVLAAWFGVDRSTITRAVNEIRPLPAERGCRVEDGRRLRPLAEVVEHLGRSGTDSIVDATEVRVRRPAAGTAGRDRFVSGNSRQNAVKTMIVTDEVGRMLFCGATTPGSTADITQARQSELVTLLKNTTGLRVLADAGYQVLGARTGGQVIALPYRKFRKNPSSWYEEIHTRQRKAHSLRRIRVEHGIAHVKNWRSLTRHLGRRETFADTVRAVAGLLSDHQYHDRVEAARTTVR